MSFNPDPIKQADEVISSHKLQKSTHPTLSFNNNTVTQSATQKHLMMSLDTKLDFQGYLKNTWPLLTIYMSFIRPHLCYGYIIYIRHTMFHFTKNYNLLNTTHSSYNGHYKMDIYRETLYWARFENLWKKMIIQETYAVSINFVKVILQNTLLTLFLYHE